MNVGYSVSVLNETKKRLYNLLEKLEYTRYKTYFGLSIEDAKYKIIREIKDLESAISILSKCL